MDRDILFDSAFHHTAHDLLLRNEEDDDHGEHGQQSRRQDQIPLFDISEGSR